MRKMISMHQISMGYDEVIKRGHATAAHSAPAAPFYGRANSPAADGRNTKRRDNRKVATAAIPEPAALAAMISTGWRGSNPALTDNKRAAL